MNIDDARPEYFSAKQIWRIQAPPKISFFTWEACRNWILNIDNLMKREKGERLLYV